MKKKIIIICSIILIILISVIAYFTIRTNNIKKYTNTEKYEINNEEIISVKKAIGEKEILKYSKTKESLELIFKDTNKEKTVGEYIQYLVDNGNYIKANMEDKNKKQISRSANNSNNIVIVETQIIDEGFKLTIQVGPGQIHIDPIE
jgi:uncharacterized membrane protein